MARPQSLRFACPLDWTRDHASATIASIRSRTHLPTSLSNSSGASSPWPGQSLAWRCCVASAACFTDWGSSCRLQLAGFLRFQNLVSTILRRRRRLDGAPAMSLHLCLNVSLSALGWLARVIEICATVPCTV